MTLNLDKSSCITFNRNKSPVLHTYSIRGHALHRNLSVKDLGVTLSSNLSWELHIRNICNKAARNLGLILRLTKPFNDIYSLKILYYAHVRPHLEYCSVVWSPHQHYLVDDIEKIQRRFLRLVGVRLGYRYTEVPIQDIATFLNIPSLSSRRCIQDVMFLYRLINAELDCPDLLEKINFKASFGTRVMNSFTNVAASSSYAANGPMLRIQRLGNNIPSTSTSLSHPNLQSKAGLHHYS
ncbi:uncharacterized protein LOC124371344 [Homalodisca vitripennis]|uniref:uncharacterized protein LOC124371344 n=1 Tax=Homalodisca vitripennis TaxID=197043 RepID=UPI001EEC3692|nr:uncharacterized protein LOC124371344 [Homalodisca vitripennis]